MTAANTPASSSALRLQPHELVAGTIFSGLGSATIGGTFTPAYDWQGRPARADDRHRYPLLWSVANANKMVLVSPAPLGTVGNWFPDPILDGNSQKLVRVATSHFGKKSTRLRPPRSLVLDTNNLFPVRGENVSVDSLLEAIAGLMPSMDFNGVDLFGNLDGSGDPFLFGLPYETTLDIDSSFYGGVVAVPVVDADHWRGGETLFCSFQGNFFVSLDTTVDTALLAHCKQQWRTAFPLFGRTERHIGFLRNNDPLFAFADSLALALLQEAALELAEQKVFVYDMGVTFGISVEPAVVAFYTVLVPRLLKTFFGLTDTNDPPGFTPPEN